MHKYCLPCWEVLGDQEASLGCFERVFSFLSCFYYTLLRVVCQGEKRNSVCRKSSMAKDLGRSAPAAQRGIVKRKPPSVARFLFQLIMRRKRAGATKGGGKTPPTPARNSLWVITHLALATTIIIHWGCPLLTQWLSLCAEPRPTTKGRVNANSLKKRLSPSSYRDALGLVAYLYSPRRVSDSGSEIPVV